MSDKRIVGVDIGTYAVKVVYLDPKSSDMTVLGMDTERVVTRAPKPEQTAGPADETAPVKPPPMPGGDPSFEDAPTGVREAPAAPGDADETTEKDDKPGAGDGEETSDSLEFTTGPAWVQALERLRDREALDGELHATAVPDGKAVTLEIDVPFLDKAKVQNILPHLMVDRLPMQQSEITWDFQTYERADEEEGARALVGFARNADLGTALEQLQGAGVDPAQLGVAELQLAAVGMQIVRETEGITAFVDLGHENTRVAIVRGWEPLIGRSIRTGGKQITEAIQAKLQKPFAEAENVKHQFAAIFDDQGAPSADMKQLSDAIRDALRPVVRDLRRTFQGLYAKKRVEVERVYLCGGTSQIKNLEKYLTAELGVPTRRLPSPAVGLGAPDVAAVSVLALGAALSQQNEQVRNRSVNLRQGQFAYRGRSSYIRRQLMFAAAAIFMLMCVLGLTLYMQKLSYESQRDAMKAALATQTKALFGAELTSKSAIEKVVEGEGGTSSNSFIPNMSAYHLLHEVTVKMPKDVEITLERIEIDTDRNLIQVYGETTDAQAVDRIVSDLEQGIECLKEIKKDKLRVRDDKADFELQISSGCS